MKERKTFWDKNAGRYDRFMRKDRAAYEEMYKLIRPVVKAKTVLELATGTGLIAKHIVNAAAHIEATDASAEMIAEAKRDNLFANSVEFSIVFSTSDLLPEEEKEWELHIECVSACQLQVLTTLISFNDFNSSSKWFFIVSRLIQ